MSKRHRYTLRGRIGSRPDTLPVHALTAIGFYVLSCVAGWTVVAVLIVVVVKA